MSNYYPEGRRIHTPQNKAMLQSASTLAEACREGQILEARTLLCDKEHNLIVDLGCMQGEIPREECAVGIREGTVRDIAILSRVNRPVSFVVTGFREENGRTIACLSRRLAQEQCHSAYLSHLVPGDVIDATVTHLEPFGAFADIGCGIVALLPIDTISVSRIHHPDERFLVGMEIRAVVKSVEGGRITLSHKELLGTWQENAACFSVGSTVSGIVRSVESYGVFVELTPNLAGLAERREHIAVGQQASVYIKNIIPSRMKVKLVIIDTFDQEDPPAPPRYFFTGSHMDRFCYTPPECEKEVTTIFLPNDEAPR